MRRDKAIKTVNDMPDEFDLEDLIERLIFMDKVEKGLKDSEEGRTISMAELKREDEKEMAEIRFAESFWDDIDDITDFIALDSIHYAIEFGDKVIERVQQLERFPRSGTVVEEYQNELLRELNFGNYRIVYRIYSEDLVIVLRIVHGARKTPL